VPSISLFFVVLFLKNVEKGPSTTDKRFAVGQGCAQRPQSLASQQVKGYSVQTGPSNHSNNVQVFRVVGMPYVQKVFIQFEGLVSLSTAAPAEIELDKLPIQVDGHIDFYLSSWPKVKFLVNISHRCMSFHFIRYLAATLGQMKKSAGH